jgi:DNA-binding LacI/PurR family transcriptional regulator
LVVTITDVARAAGVSPSTVSRALSAPGRVDPGTRARILQLVEHLGYHPNRAARGLITGRTGNLGLLVPDLTNPVFPSLVKAAQHHAHGCDYQLLMMDTDEDPDAELGLVRALAKQVDGIILCSPRMPSAQLREAATLCPTVLVNRQERRVPSVVFDTVDAIRRIIAHLVELGHRQVGFVGGPRSSWSNARRVSGLRQVSGEAGVRLVELGHFPPTFQGGRTAVDAVLLSGVTAVLGYNDLVAAGLCRALAERGIDVPAQLSVVGTDGIALASLVHPPLTTLAVPTDAAGREAVELLLRLLSDPTATRTPQVEVPTELVVGGTTAPPPSPARTHRPPATPTRPPHRPPHRPPQRPADEGGSPS